jgi:hypothetical protein
MSSPHATWETFNTFGPHEHTFRMLKRLCASSNRLQTFLSKTKNQPIFYYKHTNKLQIFQRKVVFQTNSTTSFY